MRNGLLEGGRSDAEAPSGPGSRAQQEWPPTSRTQPYDLLHVGSTDLIACVGPCLVIISYTFTLAGVEAIGRGMAKLVARQQKICSISFVERKSGPGTAPEARDAVAEIVRKHDKNITGAAIVCDGTGFRATAVRSVVTAIHMASRASYASKVFASSEPALEWLQNTRGTPDLDLKLLAQASVSLRARLKDQLVRAGAVQPGEPGA